MEQHFKAVWDFKLVLAHFGSHVNMLWDIHFSREAFLIENECGKVLKENSSLAEVETLQNCS